MEYRVEGNYCIIKERMGGTLRVIHYLLFKSRNSCGIVLKGK
jgi:hypothetical protein